MTTDDPGRVIALVSHETESIARGGRVTPFAKLGRDAVYVGDCREVLAAMEPESFDAVVTDPPYELGFMGKRWDASGVAFDAETWRAVLRVMKPGAHLLAFGGTRTSHRMVCAIEDAGFEIRDSLAWLFGSGFPKSLDVSKAIDKAGGVSPEQQAAILKRRRLAAGLSVEDVAERVGCQPVSIRDWEEGRAREAGRAVEHITPSPAYRAALADLLGFTRDERIAVGITTARVGDGSVLGLGHTGRRTSGGATDAARQWEGWGTALKPCHEPIVLARKPLRGTVAANVLGHGTGALNIDGCKVATKGRPFIASTPKAGDYSGVFREGSKAAGQTSAGRWPGNVVLGCACEDEHEPDCAVRLLDEQSGESSSSPVVRRNSAGRMGYGGSEVGFTTKGHGGSGGASRFFYTAKASRGERTHGGAAENKHPTVKPLALMRWLCRLVTPPGGRVLDPFGGSGSTWLACMDEGFACTVVELLEEHARIIVARAHAHAGFFAGAGP